MASPILHIKDSYYFDVSKTLHQYIQTDRKSLDAFPTETFHWLIRHDEHFLVWEANLMYPVLAQMPGVEHMQTEQVLFDSYIHWRDSNHDHAGKPMVRYLEQAPEASWYQEKMNDPAWKEANQTWVKDWTTAQQKASDVNEYKSFVRAEAEKGLSHWNAEKCEHYNKALVGKVVIPQPFGTMRNLYEKESGFLISKFMIIEVVVALILVAVFFWLGRRMRSGDRPRGRVWNLLEAILLFMRDEVAKPAIGHDAGKFMPLLWTIFFFILGCNLMGAIPWVGSPTGTWSVTLALAAITFGTVIISGSMKFGLVGFWLNQIPGMDLPLAIAIVIKPMIFVIEIVGLFIKHVVLSVRLLANMMAGHLVLLGILMLCFSAEGAFRADGDMGVIWPITAFAAIVGSTLFSCLELFVAFLQAYIFTFLSALFIGSAIHRH